MSSQNCRERAASRSGSSARSALPARAAPRNADEQRQQHEMRDADPDEHRAPADLHHHGGEQRDHDELPDAHARHRERVGETGAARIGARHDHADDHQRGRAVTDREHDTVEQQRVPWLRDEAHGRDAGAADRGTGDQERARREAVGHAPRDERRDRRHHHVEPDRKAELAARPAELVDHRLEGEPDCEARAPADQQHQKAGHKRERGTHGPPG